MTVRGIVFALALAATTAVALGQEVTLEQIMAHPDWLGRQPIRPYWADDSKSIYYSRKVEGTEERRLYQVSLDGSPMREYPDAERDAADFAGGDWSANRRLKAYSRNGDLFVKEVASGVVRQLTRTNARETAPWFMRGDDRIAFHRGARIVVRELASGLEYEPAVLLFEKDPDAEEDDDYLRDQQRRLLDVVREQERKKKAARDRDRDARDNDATRVPNAFYLGEDLALKGLRLSPDGRWMVVVLGPKDAEETTRGKPDQMPTFVTDSGYIEYEEVHPLVGTGTPTSDKVLLLDLDNHEETEIAFDTLPGIHDDPLADLRAKRPTGDEEETIEAEKDFIRPVYLGSGSIAASAASGILWSDDGSKLVLHVFAHDHKDRWIAEVDLEERTLASVQRFTDDAWINWSMNQVGFLDESTTLFFTSEDSGYSQLYTLDLETSETMRLTDGDFVVAGATQSLDGRYLYYTANAAHPGVTETYRYDLGRRMSERVTNLGGRNGFVLAPDSRRVLLTHSDTTHPPELYVQRTRAGADAVKVTSTTSERFRSVDWVAPEIVAIPSTHHERPIFSRVYGRSAASTDPRPAVVFVHGAGYLQNAHQGWSGYFREFMFHTLLVQKGFVVLDMDYRASAGYGRDWRTAIYRQMGTPELEDLQDGVDWLVENANVDRERVGVYGGSYGGFITLMALFKQPDLFAAGAALRPVTDWAHYRDGYTAHILNTPTIDPEAYERSSPIEFAEGLSKPLLIAHGMLDDNVFFKDSVRLVQRLIELEKTGWTSAIYPVEPHGFREPSSWLDEYRRIYELFQTHLQGMIRKEDG